MTRAVLEAARGENPDRVPSVAWFKTRKGRGYGKYDNKSHGTPHAMNAPEFWAVRNEFMAAPRRRSTPGVDEPAPADAEARDAQARHNFEVAMGVLRARPTMVDAITRPAGGARGLGPEDDRRIQPSAVAGRRSSRDPRFTDFRSYPADDVEEAGREGAEPRRARDVGRLGQRVRAGGVRPAAVHRLLR